MGAVCETYTWKSIREASGATSCRRYPSARTRSVDHASLFAAVDRRNGLHDVVRWCIAELEMVPSIARGLSASRDCRQCCNHQSGSEECLRGKFSNAILRLSNSCDVSGYSSTACELASEIAGQESELSMSDMIATSETLLDLLGDAATSN